MKKHKEAILSDVKPSKAIIGLAIPATLALLAKAVYNIVDTAYIGMLESKTALAAVGVTLPLLLIMVSLENIFAAGAAVLAGRQLGAGDKEGANATVSTIVALSVGIGVALCVCGIACMDPLLLRVRRVQRRSPGGQTVCAVDVRGGTGESARTEHELRRACRVIGQDLFHCRDHRRGAQCDP